MTSKSTPNNSQTYINRFIEKSPFLSAFNNANHVKYLDKAKVEPRGIVYLI